MRQYYENVFPEGRVKAQKLFHATELLLSDTPYIGHATHRKGVREFSIPKIPFSNIYRIRQDRIEVLRICDERREREIVESIICFYCYHTQANRY